jgi:hypothetical protein
MKTIRTAKTKIYSRATVYYVPSKSGGPEHIVVSNASGVFCDCKDFMTRRLPLLGTNGFSNCTHGKQVIALSMGHTIEHKSSGPEDVFSVYGHAAPTIRAKAAKPTKQKYGIFYIATGSRSLDFPKTYGSKTAAEKALKKSTFAPGYREVRAL